MLEIIPLLALKDNYIWIIKNPENKHVAIIDPSEPDPALKYLKNENLTPVAILITHHHWDHVGGIPEITRKYDIPVYTPKMESVEGSTNPVGEGNIVSLPELDLALNILDVPGHTAGAVAYYSHNFVFSGDTLFTAGCGRLFEGTPSQMYISLNKFKDLPDKTLLYCGHEYTLANLQFAHAVEPANIAIRDRLEQVRIAREKNKVTIPSTLAIEKETNPFLRCEKTDVIDAASRHVGKSLNEPGAVFAAIRDWKNNF